MSKEYHTFHIHSQFAQLLSNIRRGSLDKVKQLLIPDGNVQENRITSSILHLRDRNGRTALHHCAETMVPTPNNSSPLHPRSRSNQLFEIAQILIKLKPPLVEWQDNEGNIPLHLAVINGNLPLTKLFLRLMSPEQVNIGDYELHTTVHWATVCGELECLAVVVESGGVDCATADIYGAHPLHYATQSFVAATGIDIPGNMNGTTIKPSNGRVNSAFYRTSLAHQRQSIRRTNGMRILHYLLSRPNVDVNCADNEGRTPLLWAASSGKFELNIFHFNN